MGEHIDDVVSSPKEYIDHPEKLRWEWLTEWLGVRQRPRGHAA